MANYWIDTDPGIDDALAILMALLEAGPAVAGFSTVFGNHPESISARNLARLLSRLTETGLTPANWQPKISRGAEKPLQGVVLSSEGIHGADGLGEVDWVARPPWLNRLQPARTDLAPVLAGINSLNLVCLGPLTNLALALEAAPGLVNQVEKIYIMGGSLRSGGNASMAAEYNFLSDPQAVRQVLNAGFKQLRLIPLDAAISCRFKLEHLEKLEKINTPPALIARQLLRVWEGRIRGRGQGMYDLVAWLLVTHPQWSDWEEVYVDVDVAGGLAHGASLADWRNRSGKPPNLKAALAVDGEAMWNYFLGKLENDNY
jgi:inosine-uridine nucleoside N-ribohydrolase